MIKQIDIDEYRFSSVDLEIATRFDLKIDRWEEDGLGPAQGMFIKLTSGKVMLLR